jgi:hypothetical protein
VGGGLDVGTQFIDPYSKISKRSQSTETYELTKSLSGFCVDGDENLVSIISFSVQVKRSREI